jgi:hypothetical protein
MPIIRVPGVLLVRNIDKRLGQIEKKIGYVLIQAKIRNYRRLLFKYGVLGPRTHYQLLLLEYTFYPKPIGNTAWR